MTMASVHVGVNQRSAGKATWVYLGVDGLAG